MGVFTGGELCGGESVFGENGGESLALLMRKSKRRTTQKHVTPVAGKSVKQRRPSDLDGPYPVRDFPADSYQRGWVT